MDDFLATEIRASLRYGSAEGVELLCPKRFFGVYFHSSPQSDSCYNWMRKLVSCPGYYSKFNLERQVKPVSAAEETFANVLILAQNHPNDFKET